MKNAITRVAMLSGFVSVLLVVSVRSGESRGQQPGPRRTVLAGVYTSAQAKRGQDAYRASCLECHGEDLHGVEEVRAPALVGQRFATVWGMSTVGDLFTRIINTMPQNAPGTLDRQTYLDVLTYVLQSNGYPAGDSELPGDASTLQGIDIVVPRTK